MISVIMKFNRESLKSCLSLSLIPKTVLNKKFDRINNKIKFLNGNLKKTINLSTNKNTYSYNRIINALNFL